MGKKVIRLTKQEHKYIIFNMLKAYKMELWAVETTKKYKIKKDDAYPVIDSVRSLFQTIYLLDSTLYNKVKDLKVEEGLKIIIEYVTDKQVESEPMKVVKAD